MAFPRIPVRSVAIAVALVAAAEARAENPTVFAAASLTDALEDIGRAYERETGRKIDFDFGGSSDLARQIEAGAPADVFFSAGEAQMNGLVDAGLVKAADTQNVLSSSLVVVVPKGSTATVRGPADLAGFERVALANPDAVPVGVYTRKYLEGLGLWEKVKPRIVPTVDARAALAAVADEHADAGVVYRTDAAISPKVAIAFEVPREQGPRIVYQLAPVATSKRTETADVVAYLVSPPALTVYERYGFIVILEK